MKLSLQASGGAALARRLQQLPSAVSWDVQRKALQAGAEPIRAEAAIQAPRDAQNTGGTHLADHVIVDALTRAEVERSTEFHADDAVVLVGPNLPHFYGYFLERGTVKMAAQPFMRPAFDLRSQEALRITLAHLWRSLEAVASQRVLTLPTNVSSVGSRNL